jgi:hypothetical protein
MLQKPGAAQFGPTLLDGHYKPVNRRDAAVARSTSRPKAGPGRPAPAAPPSAPARPCSEPSQHVATSAPVVDVFVPSRPADLLVEVRVDGDVGSRQTAWRLLTEKQPA